MRTVKAVKVVKVCLPFVMNGLCLAPPLRVKAKVSLTQLVVCLISAQTRMISAKALHQPLIKYVNHGDVNRSIANSPGQAFSCATINSTQGH